MKIEIKLAYDQIPIVQYLFTQYYQELGIDLKFQYFDEELASLPGKYALPDGRLYLVYVEEGVAGCVAYRRLSATDCEMKRLFILPNYRKIGLGEKLVNHVICDAKNQGYSRMYLDTLSTMHPAMKLYKKIGFVETQPYYHNPIQEAIYFILYL